MMFLLTSLQMLICLSGSDSALQNLMLLAWVISSSTMCLKVSWFTFLFLYSLFLVAQPPSNLSSSLCTRFIAWENNLAYLIYCGFLSFAFIGHLFHEVVFLWCFLGSFALFKFVVSIKEASFILGFCRCFLFCFLLYPLFFINTVPNLCF